MRVGIFLRYPFHAQIFRSTTSALGAEHCCLATGDPAELMRFRPHVVLAAEDISYLHLRGHLPRSLFVHTRHGLASKGIPKKSFRAADYVCVTSEKVRGDFVARGIRPRRAYWVVGYIQMDNLFGAARPPELPERARVVLYAPTWHHGLSSLPLLGPRVVDLLQGASSDTFLVIKPHPLVQQGVDPALAPWMEQLRQACRGRHNVHLIDDRGADVMPWLKAANVLVTDASSVQLEYLALNRPMVLINHPDRLQSRHYDPSGYEWTWRDMGQQVDDVETLPQAVAAALADPSLGEKARAKYRAYLFGDTADGCAGERLAAQILSLRSSVASETSLLAVSPVGHVFYRCLPHLRNISYAFRRMRSA